MIRFLWNPSVYIKMLEDYLHDKSMKGYHLDDCWYFFAKFKNWLNAFEIGQFWGGDDIPLETKTYLNGIYNNYVYPNFINNTS